MNSWRKIEPNLLILSLKGESRWVYVTKFSKSCMNSSLLKMKKNKMEENTHLNLVFLVLMYEKSQFPMSFAIIALEYVRLPWGMLAAGGCRYFFLLYINSNNLMSLDERRSLKRVTAIGDLLKPASCRQSCWWFNPKCG